MGQEIFADNISAIHVTGNMIRIDLITLQPQLKNENGQPVFDVSNRIVMPLAGFINAFGVQESIIKQLIDAGVLKNTTDTVTAVSEEANNLGR